MPDSFTLHLPVNGVEQDIECVIRVSTYTYQILCTIGHAQVIFEKDDEGKLRALDADPFSGRTKKSNPAFVRLLMEEMEKVLQ